MLTPTEGTILTVAREAVEYAVSRITGESTITSLFADLTEEMYASLQRTPEFLAVLKEAGVIDSGGAGLLYIMQGFNRVLRGERIAYTDDGARSVQSAPTSAAVFDSESEMTYGYCTELLLQLQSRKTDLSAFDLKTVTDFLASVGNSVVAVVDGTILKVHVHTMTPERVLEFCHAFGEFITLKIENMSLQHNETLVAGAEKSAEKAKPRKRYGSIAVCSGAGIEATFREFGVDEIVAGGQTSNPSTGDFLRAFDRVAAEHIFVFPNNGNIYLAAKQAASIYRGADVRVCGSNATLEKHLSRMGVPVSEADPGHILYPWTKVVLVAPDEIRAESETAHALCAWIAAQFPGRYEAVPSGALVDVVATGSDKGSGVRRLAEFLDILPENIVCIGDGWNDIPMLRAAGRAFAPETALPEVLALPGVTKLSAPGRCIRDVIDRLEADQK